jgi:plasmid stabilization system protein ParE
VSILRTDVFLADIERQFEWYGMNVDWEVAERYLMAVENTCKLLERQPRLGPLGHFTHARLRDWRFFLVHPPFKKHILFYEVVVDDVIMRRALHGHRNLPIKLLKG